MSLLLIESQLQKMMRICMPKAANKTNIFQITDKQLLKTFLKMGQEFLTSNNYPFQLIFFLFFQYLCFAQYCITLCKLCFQHDYTLA